MSSRSSAGRDETHMASRRERRTGAEAGEGRAGGAGRALGAGRRRGPPGWMEPLPPPPAAVGGPCREGRWECGGEALGRGNSS